jgi:phosphate transport system permease protein
MVIGNAPNISLSLLSPAYTMPSVIANEFAETTSKLHASALMEIGLILMVVTLIVNAMARLMIWSVSKTATGGAA